MESHPELIQEEIELILSHPGQAAVHATHIPATYDSIEDRVPGISCPALVIWGIKGHRQESGPRVVAAIPDSDLCVIPGDGHHAHLAAPDVLAEALSTFLARVELRQAA